MTFKIITTLKNYSGRLQPWPHGVGKNGKLDRYWKYQKTAVY
jgi:hypothetical protein